MRFCLIGLGRKMDCIKRGVSNFKTEERRFMMVKNKVVIKNEYLNNAEKRGKEVVLCSDENLVLPDGSCIIYAENNRKIILIQRRFNNQERVYEFDRQTKEITLDGELGSEKDKNDMLELGIYLVQSNSLD